MASPKLTGFVLFCQCAFPDLIQGSSLQTTKAMPHALMFMFFSLFLSVYLSSLSIPVTHISLLCLSPQWWSFKLSEPNLHLLGFCRIKGICSLGFYHISTTMRCVFFAILKFDIGMETVQEIQFLVFQINALTAIAIACEPTMENRGEDTFSCAQQDCQIAASSSNSTTSHRTLCFDLILPRKHHYIPIQRLFNCFK